MSQALRVFKTPESWDIIIPMGEPKAYPSDNNYFRFQPIH